MPESSLKYQPVDSSNYLLEPEFREHYESWKATPNPQTTSNLLKVVDPVIDSALKTYAARGNSPTLRSKAKLLAVDAFQRYDPSRAKLRTHLMSHLQGLRRASAQESQIISIPERVGLDLHHLRMSENELRDKLGREPSDMELADHTSLSRRRIEYIRKAQPGLAEGAMAPEGEADEGQGIGPGVVGPENDTWVNFVYHDLSPVDQVIMEHTLGLHGKPVLPKQHIAAKLRLSAGAISQRAAKIQEKIDRKDELGVNFF